MTVPCGKSWQREQMTVKQWSINVQITVDDPIIRALGGKKTVIDRDEAYRW